MPTSPQQSSSPDPSRRRQEAQARINSLRDRASRGIWLVAAFLAVSIAASRGFDLLPSFSAGARQWLGPAPPVRMIQLALVGYAFSASVLILSRMAKGDPPGRNYAHLFYLAAFFGFFHFAEALRENFWAVLVAGVTVLGLAAYQGWAYCTEQLRLEEELLASYERPDRADRP